jgi:hypothetical protein
MIMCEKINEADGQWVIDPIIYLNKKRVTRNLLLVTFSVAI